MATEIERKRNKVDCGPEMSAGMEEDRLSSLPDEIIHHILSFIKTKFAVQTCVLSSRWKLIWTCLPHLKLSSCEFRTLPKFSKFVNRLLSHRKNYTEVSTVDLCFRGRSRQKFVEKIISYALSHNVHKIKILFDAPKGDDQLPPCLFSSESLKHLTLSTPHYCSYDAFPCSQSAWNFPALTTLELKNILLCYDNTTSLDLFSKCVNLKNLTLEGCRGRGLEVMQISCPQLVNLTLLDMWNSKFTLLTPNLSYLYYRGDNDLSISTDGLHCLDSVNLEMYSPSSGDGRQKDAHRLVALFQQLRNAKYLRVFSNFIEFLSTVPDILEQQPSPFSNLKCLKIKFYEMQKSTNSAMIDQAIKYLFNSSSSFNVIMELQEDLSPPPYTENRFIVARLTAAQRRNVQALSKVAEMLSSQEMTDPHIRQALQDVKKELAQHSQKLGLPPRRQSK